MLTSEVSSKTGLLGCEGLWNAWEWWRPRTLLWGKPDVWARHQEPRRVALGSKGGS